LGFDAGRAFHGGDDSRVSAATAEIAVHPFDNLLAIGR
jgi:hypothetical protein